MTAIGGWFKKVLEALMPSQEGNAWDELKRARAMEAAQRRVNEVETPTRLQPTAFRNRYRL